MRVTREMTTTRCYGFVIKHFGIIFFICRHCHFIVKMVVQLRPRAITVERGSRGFGLSLIYRGLDKYEEKDTGIFVARVVPGGQAARYGVREDDKLLTINGKTPRNVDDAVGVIKQAGNQIKLVVLRAEDVPGNPDIMVDPSDPERTSLASAEMDSKWVSISFMRLAYVPILTFL